MFVFVRALHKLSRARVNTLLFTADRRLLTPRADDLDSYLISKLADPSFHNTYRPTAFVRLLRFCLQRHLFDVALALHTRMRKEGFYPLHALALRMSALHIAHQSSHLTDTIAPLKKLFEDEAYDVSAFLDLVHYLVDDKHAPGSLVDDLAHAFVSMRQIKLSDYPDLVGELVRVNVRAARLEAAQTWLSAFEDSCGAQGVQPDVTPYSDIIHTLHDIYPNNGTALQDVLVRMKSAGVAPDTNVFNALVRANVIQQRYQEAFALYHVLMQKRSRELMPNDVTFKIFFRTTIVLSHPRRGRRHRPPGNTVPPRRLFRDMFACHLEQVHGRPSAPSTVVSVSACHLALRTFMARQDYAAAFVVIRTLHVVGFQPNLQTYLIVLVSLLHRSKREANLSREQGSYRLVDFLTHLRPNEDPDLHTLLDRIRQPTEPSPVGVEMMSHLLHLGEPTRPTDDDLPDVPALPHLPSQAHSHIRGRHARIPTVAMLTGVEALATQNQRAFFSPVPLARILYKALLSELLRKAVHRANWNWKGAASPIVEETGREMVPEGIANVSASDSGTSEKRVTEGVLPFAASRIRRRRRSARGGREIAFDFEK